MPEWPLARRNDVTIAGGQGKGVRATRSSRHLIGRPIKHPTCANRLDCPEPRVVERGLESKVMQAQRSAAAYQEPGQKIVPQPILS
jgi:hypothetical protein